MDWVVVFHNAEIFARDAVELSTTQVSIPYPWVLSPSTGSPGVPPPLRGPMDLQVPEALALTFHRRAKCLRIPSGPKFRSEAVNTGPLEHLNEQPRPAVEKQIILPACWSRLPASF